MKAIVFLLSVLTSFSAQAAPVQKIEYKSAYITQDIPLECEPGMGGPGGFGLPSGLTIAIPATLFPDSILTKVFYSDHIAGDHCNTLPGEFTAILPAIATFERILTEECKMVDDHREMQTWDHINARIDDFVFRSGTELVTRQRIPGDHCP